MNGRNSRVLPGERGMDGLTTQCDCKYDYMVDRIYCRGRRDDLLRPEKFVLLSHSRTYFTAVQRTITELDLTAIDRLVAAIASLRARGGRLFLLGVGGSAGNCSHAVNDFRKLCGIEAYAPVDNVSELTARTNDEGWSTVFAAWLKVSRLDDNDAILVLSVGGGSEARNVSMNIVEAIKYAKACSARTFAIVGRPDGYAAQHGDEVVLIPKTEEHLVTPISESFQSLVWHCLVSHPDLQMNATKW